MTTTPLPPTSRPELGARDDWLTTSYHHDMRTAAREARADAYPDIPDRGELLDLERETRP